MLLFFATSLFRSSVDQLPSYWKRNPPETLSVLMGARELAQKNIINKFLMTVAIWNAITRLPDFNHSNDQIWGSKEGMGGLPCWVDMPTGSSRAGHVSWLSLPRTLGKTTMPAPMQPITKFAMAWHPMANRSQVRILGDSRADLNDTLKNSFGRHPKETNASNN